MRAVCPGYRPACHHRSALTGVGRRWARALSRCAGIPAPDARREAPWRPPGAEDSAVIGPVGDPGVPPSPLSPGSGCGQGADRPSGASPKGRPRHSDPRGAVGLQPPQLRARGIQLFWGAPAALAGARPGGLSRHTADRSGASCMDAAGAPQGPGRTRRPTAETRVPLSVRRRPRVPRGIRRRDPSLRRPPKTVLDDMPAYRPEQGCRQDGMRPPVCQSAGEGRTTGCPPQGFYASIRVVPEANRARDIP